ncbi:hypothetical protein [Staphylococcus epidermidis]|uniref:hypothetical protein n=1 Tax=Staphylococcus epidermidis TaxID=1282 RepID=UPI00287F73B3|nr:hypothetical protein [Staphylococcus epidermidis]
MQQPNELSTKNASQFLNISVSSMRLYAKTMESLGYEFKTVENARRFTKYDLQIIYEAMERFKLVGGTMKQSLHYTIVKYEQGQEIADAMPQTTKKNRKVSDELEALQTNMINEVSNNLKTELVKQYNELSKTIKNSQAQSSEIKYIKADYQTLNDKYNALLDENKKLKEEKIKDFMKK